MATQLTAASAQVEIDGQPLPPEVEIIQLVVEDSLHHPDAFAIELRDIDRGLVGRAKLKIGAKVKIGVIGDTFPSATTLIEGEGEGAAVGDVLTVHYVGVLADGTEFDQSWSRGQPFVVENLGQAAVIPGWNEGLVGAKIGERRRLEIGSDKAYGAAGSPPQIPANAPLAFEIDVVDVTKPGG